MSIEDKLNEILNRIQRLEIEILELKSLIKPNTYFISSQPNGKNLK